MPKSRSPTNRHRKLLWLLRPFILERDNHTCQACGFHGNPWELTVDHVVPAFLGGHCLPHNLRVLCYPCHEARNRRISSHLNKVKKGKANLDVQWIIDEC